MYISKSAQDGYLGKQELLKEIKNRLRRGNLKIEDIEGIIKDWYLNQEEKHPYYERIKKAVEKLEANQDLILKTPADKILNYLIESLNNDNK